MTNSIITKPTNRHYNPSQIDIVEVGDWYWVKDEPEDGRTELFCVEKIGSNYIGFVRNRNSKHSGEEGFRLHIDQFEERCVKEENWQSHFKNKIDSLALQLKHKTNELIQVARQFHLLPQKENGFTPTDSADSFLPSTISINPEKYKNDLVELKNNRVPEIQKDIENLAISFATANKDQALSDLNKLEMAKEAFKKIEDKIFIIELYSGIKEYVKQIAGGNPASINEPIAIRQQLLYMDEETLIDFDKGGMDFESIEDFDTWIIKPGNLNRILPDQKGIVAFRIRRNDKDYGSPLSLWEAFRIYQKNCANMETYLLIRNGDNVYRINSMISFSPRLIPFKNEIGEKQFINKCRWGDREDEIITVDDVRYDDHTEIMDGLIKKYNRIFILIQGLLDRSVVFHPHVGIKLNRQDHIENWIKCVRDEELGLPNNTISFEEYKKQLNKTLKTGNWIWSNWTPNDIGRYSSRSGGITYDTKRESEIGNRPIVCKTTKMKRDKTQVSVSWEVDVWSWPRINDTTNRHLWIPVDKVFNLSGYNRGDYKMFLCDRALQGSYLEWAPQLLTAEKMLKENKNEF